MISSIGRSFDMPISTKERLTAAQILRANPRFELRKIFAEETESLVVLRGVVSSYYLKQVAQETVKSILDGRKLENLIVVSSSQSSS
jgi:hypothetical protein